MDRSSLTAQEMPCSEERAAALKCSEVHAIQADKKKNCQDFFDEYKECKKKYVESRNTKNYMLTAPPVEAKQPETAKTPW